MSVKTDFAKRVTVASVDLQTGEYHEFNQSNTNYYDFGQAALASGSIPGVFPPMSMVGSYFVDGGTVWNINIDSAINQCLDMGAAPEEITLDVLVCHRRVPKHAETGSSVDNWHIKRDIQKYYGDMDNIDTEMRANPRINMRFYFMLHSTGCDEPQMNFNGDATWCFQEAGRRDAAKALDMGRRKQQSLFD